MDEFMLEWAMNSLDQTEDPFQVTNIENFQDSQSISDCCIDYSTTIPPVIDVPNNDQFGFLQGTVEVEGNNSTWNSYDHSKATQSNFGGTEDLNLTSHNLSKKAFGSNKQIKGIRMNSKKFAYSQDHVIAERKRREKINQRLIELSSIIPYIKKTDKASILVDAVKYVKELQEKVKALEAQKAYLIDSVVLVKNSDLSSKAADHGGSSSTKPEPLPVIKAQLSGDILLISIHCETFKGLLVKILSELEKLNLTVTHTSLMPFSASTAFITLNTQIDEGSNNAVSSEDVVRKLSSALNELKSRSSHHKFDIFN